VNVGLPSETIKAAAVRIKALERENATLRAALVNADELERYTGSDGHRQWGRCSAWLHPDDAVVIISAKTLDAARKEAQP
jgi:hypothetical protein